MDVSHIPGSDFNPSSNQLLTHYLKQRILDYFQSSDPNYSTNRHLIPDIDLYNWDPKDLPRQYGRLSEVRSNGRQWFFFCLRKEKYYNSSRSKRTVSNVDQWKIISSDKKVKSDDTGEELGKKKTLTFYRGRMPNRIMTKWGMHEYYLNPSYLGYDIEEMPFVVCHVFKRRGTRHGNNVKSANPADDSGDPDTSKSHAPQYDQAALNKEQGMRQSLTDTQQLPRDLPEYGFIEKAEYHSYADGEVDGNGSNSYYASSGETYYYHQQYQGGRFY